MSVIFSFVIYSVSIRIVWEQGRSLQRLFGMSDYFLSLAM